MPLSRVPTLRGSSHGLQVGRQAPRSIGARRDVHDSDLSVGVSFALERNLAAAARAAGLLALRTRALQADHQALLHGWIVGIQP